MTYDPINMRWVGKGDDDFMGDFSTIPDSVSEHDGIITYACAIASDCLSQGLLWETNFSFLLLSYKDFLNALVGTLQILLVGGIKINLVRICTLYARYVFNSSDISSELIYLSDVYSSNNT